MERIPTGSSTMVSVGYDAKSEILDVPQGLHRAHPLARREHGRAPSTRPAARSCPGAHSWATVAGSSRSTPSPSPDPMYSSVAASTRSRGRYARISPRSARRPARRPAGTRPATRSPAPRGSGRAPCRRRTLRARVLVQPGDGEVMTTVVASKNQMDLVADLRTRGVEPPSLPMTRPAAGHQAPPRRRPDTRSIPPHARA